MTPLASMASIVDPDTVLDACISIEEFEFDQNLGLDTLPPGQRLSRRRGVSPIVSVIES
jgi:hypothetical protein